jgi:hypothetical protein
VSERAEQQGHEPKGQQNEVRGDDKDQPDEGP